jgi:hypothetical protein
MEKVDVTYASPYPVPTIYAGEFRVHFPEPINDRELKERISTFLASLLDFLYSQGCRLIGHIKGLVLTEKGGFLLLSTTSFLVKDAFKGNLPALTSKANLTLNVMVFGVSEEKIRGFVEQEVQKIFLVLSTVSK